VRTFVMLISLALLSLTTQIQTCERATKKFDKPAPRIVVHYIPYTPEIPDIYYTPHIPDIHYSPRYCNNEGAEDFRRNLSNTLRNFLTPHSLININFDFDYDDEDRKKFRKIYRNLSNILSQASGGCLKKIKGPYKKGRDGLIRAVREQSSI